MTPRDRRALLLGASLLSLAWMALRGAPMALARWEGAGIRLTEREVLLAETRAVLAALPRMEDSAAALTAAVRGLAPRLLSGSSEPLAASELLGRVRLLAARHPIRVVSTGAVPSGVVAGPLRLVRGMTTLETDYRGLADLLQALSEDSLVIVPERLAVSALEPLADSLQPELLQVELSLSAWYFAEAAR